MAFILQERMPSRQASFAHFLRLLWAFSGSVSPSFLSSMAFIVNSIIFAYLLATSGTNAANTNADAEDSYDLSFYTKGAAIGDS